MDFLTNLSWTWIAAIVCSLVGLGLVGRWYYLKKQAEEQKGFVVIAGALLLMWFFPGAIFLILGALLVLFLLSGVF